MLQVFIVIFAITGILSKPTSATATGLDASEIGEIYLDKLLDTISGPNKSSVSVDKLNNYFSKHAIHSADYTNFTKCMVLNDTTGTVLLNEECMLNSVSNKELDLHVSDVVFVINFSLYPSDT